MKRYKPLALATGACLALVAGGPVPAVDSTDYIVQTAGGACQSNNTAVNDVRVRVGGLVNVGAPPIYVICSFPTDWQTSATHDGVTDFQIRVANTTGATQNVQCTLQPGYATTYDGATMSQGTFPKQVNLGAGSSTYISWTRSEVVGEESTNEIASPSVICLLPQGTMVHYAYYVLPENIGT